MPQRPVTVGIGIVAVCAAVFALQFTASVLIPLVVSLLLFYALDPLVHRLVRWRIPRTPAALAVMLAFVGGIGFGGWVLWPQIDQVVDEIPKGVAELRRELRRGGDGDKSTLQRVREAAKAIDAAAAEAASPPPRTPGVTPVEVRQPTRTSDWLWSGGAGALAFAGQALTVFFLTIFLLSEGDSFKRKFVRHVQTRGGQRVTVTILNDIERQVERFVLVTVASSVFVGVATGLVLWGIHVRQPAVWGLFAGVMNVVPYFGPLVVTAVLSAVGLLQFGTIADAVLVGGVTLTITSIEGMVLTPHLLSKAGSLNHVAIFTAIAFWSWAWGAPGMLLAVPMLMVFKAVCDHVEGLRAVADLLGTNEEPEGEAALTARLATPAPGPSPR
ncbi:MAG TPA: AI-2E family transporter [Vicinamibacterales bacterium]|jgi:predicted PurR-regulated permease PerM|nr:AI-2E family transporter [Vicinamibacterales bacterium]